MNVIYKPKGRALEYAPWACNLYIGCTHGCTYCYAPGCLRKKSEAYHQSSEARNDIVSLFERDAETLVARYPDDDKRRVLFCFLSDPYQPIEGRLHITRKCIQVAKRVGVKLDVLTKGAYKYVRPDLPLMKSAGAHLGVTLCYVNDDLRAHWEPEASTVADRLKLLREAHSLGIYTWISMEPVIDPSEALQLIDVAHEYVDFWKVGKLNYNKAVEEKVDWHRFYYDVTRRLKSYQCKYYIKKSLKQFARKAQHSKVAL